MLEVAVQEILECVDEIKPLPKKAETIEYIAEWGLSPVRDEFWKNPNLKRVLSGQYEAIHPFKLSPLLSQNASEARDCFCQEVLPYLYQVIN